MLKILVPVDGSPNGQYAARHVIKEYLKNRAMEIHLLNVQPPLLADIARFISRKNRADFHRDTGEKALQPMRDILDRAGVAYSVHIEVGNKSKLIAEAAAAAANGTNEKLLEARR